MQPRHVRYTWHPTHRAPTPPAEVAAWMAEHHDPAAAAVVGLVDWRGAEHQAILADRSHDALGIIGAGSGDGGLATIMRTSADDLIDLVSPAEIWRRRLSNLASLAVLRHAVQHRRLAARDFCRHGSIAPGLPPSPPHRADVLFVGAPGPHKLALVDALLGWSTATYAETVAQARRHVENAIYAAVVVSDANDSVRLHRDLVPLVHTTSPGHPSFVVVRDRQADYAAEDAYALGADEVVDPDLPRDLIQRRLSRAIHEADMRLELREERAFRDALDPVSRRLGHSAFLAFVAEELRREPRPGRAALVAVALDGLDAINREAGFAVGDEAIATAGRALAQSLRAEDCVGRVDGATFGAWIGDVDDEALPKIAQRLQARVLNAQLGGSGPTLGARVGWSRPLEGDDALSLSRRARAEARRTLLRMIH